MGESTSGKCVLGHGITVNYGFSVIFLRKNRKGVNKINATFV